MVIGAVSFSFSAVLLQVAEEEYLVQELRKIETRKKEREKKAQDLQKLITAADTTTEMRRAERKATKKKLPQKRETEKPVLHPAPLAELEESTVMEILGNYEITASWLEIIMIFSMTMIFFFSPAFKIKMAP